MKKKEDRLSEAKEDYLETILLLSKNGQPARLVDIAKEHNVSKATVSNALSCLGDAGYIVYEKYRPVFLTKSGIALAERTLDKHRLLIRFLNETLGVPAEDAREAACKMEHAIGAEIAFKLASFMDKLGESIKKTAKKKSKSADKSSKKLR